MSERKVLVISQNKATKRVGGRIPPADTIGSAKRGYSAAPNGDYFDGHNRSKEGCFEIVLIQDGHSKTMHCVTASEVAHLQGNGA